MPPERKPESNYSAHCKIFLFNRDEEDTGDNIKKHEPFGFKTKSI
jgi:hypothetical protein